MSVRKIPPNYRVNPGRYAFQRRLPSLEAPRSVDFESMLERDFLVLADFDRDVANVGGQPVHVPWQDARGRWHQYTPDFLVTFLPGEKQLPLHRPDKTRPWLVEVKDTPSLRAGWQDFRLRFRAAVGFARARGWTFHLLTERRIRTVWLENARLLLPALAMDACDYDKGRCDALLQTLENCGTLTAAELIAAACCDPINQAMLLPQLWSLVAWRNIAVDLSKPLNMNSPLWLPDYMPRQRVVLADRRLDLDRYW